MPGADEEVVQRVLRHAKSHVMKIATSRRSTRRLSRRWKNSRLQLTWWTMVHQI